LRPSPAPLLHCLRLLLLLLLWLLLLWLLLLELRLLLILLLRLLLTMRLSILLLWLLLLPVLLRVLLWLLLLRLWRLLLLHSSKWISKSKQISLRLAALRWWHRLTDTAIDTEPDSPQMVVVSVLLSPRGSQLHSIEGRVWLIRVSLQHNCWESLTAFDVQHFLPCYKRPRRGDCWWRVTQCDR
jgi:hypothetical protein